jgi:hypothetical protein
VIRDNHTYAGEVLARCEGLIGPEVIRLDPHIKALIIAELEDETTALRSVGIDGYCMLRKHFLMPGDEARIAIPKGSEKMRIAGRYFRKASTVLIRQHEDRFKEFFCLVRVYGTSYGYDL